MFGLAYGDAISFPALFHRFQAETIPRRRHNFLWRQNGDLDNKNISRVMLPFTHRIAAENLEPSPTDDTEFAMLTLKALLAESGEPSQETFLQIWRDEVLPNADSVHCSFSERSAIENLKAGLLPPATGNDNPLHYEDSAVARAVPVGLYCAGNPQRAVQFATLDAQITQAEDGIYAAQGMAAAIAALAGDGTLMTALEQARRCFPPDSWIAYGDNQAHGCLAIAETPQDMALLLSKQVINTVYSYGSAAPETFPAALAIVEVCNGDLHTATAVANAISKSADSVPAMVGALCGVYQGVNVISTQWRDALAICRGLCLPFLQGANIEPLTLQLLEKVNIHKENHQ
jgi:ADP-ribosylglycohydrolase